MHELDGFVVRRYGSLFDAKNSLDEYIDDMYDKYYNYNTRKYKTASSSEASIKSLALEKIALDPPLNDAQSLLVRLCMAELEGKSGLASVVLTQAELDILTGLLANSIVAQEKKEEN